MGWLPTIVVSVMKRVAPQIVCWWFTEERGLRHREWDRSHWWTFAERAKTTKTKADDAIAAYLKARCNFHDSPEQKDAKIAMDAVEAMRGKFSGEHQP